MRWHRTIHESETTMAKKYPCIETTIDLTIGIWLIRLWIDQDDLPTDYQHFASDFLGEITTLLSNDSGIDHNKTIMFYNRLWNKKEAIYKENELEMRLDEMAQNDSRIRGLIEFIAAHWPKVNAVQVIVGIGDNPRFGTVAYTVDFAEDAHG